MRHPDEVFERAECGDHLGRARQQRHHAHQLRSCGTGRRMSTSTKVSTPSASVVTGAPSVVLHDAEERDALAERPADQRHHAALRRARPTRSVNGGRARPASGGAGERPEHVAQRLRCIEPAVRTEHVAFRGALVDHECRERGHAGEERDRG